MPTMELSEREVKLIEFHRMTPEAQAAERQRLQAAAREAAMARLTPERRAKAEQRRAEAEAKIEAERQRVEGLSKEQREVEFALRRKTAAEAEIVRTTEELAKMDAQVVEAVQADMTARGVIVAPEVEPVEEGGAVVKPLGK